VKKWGNELNRAFSKEEVQMAKKHEEMLNIPGHKGNANYYYCYYFVVWSLNSGPTP
jgi:hypothetical protein